VCFSAEADLVAGVVVSGVGVDALRHVRRPDERPLALLPLLLGAHQLVEAFVWWGLDGEVSASIGRAAMWIYLLIAFCVVPVVVPYALGVLERRPDRRPRLGFVALGAAVAAVLLHALVRGPVSAVIEQHHIDDRIDLWLGGPVAAAYVVATVGPMLRSRQVHLRWFGVGNLVAVAALAWFASSAFISLWCVWAAVTSVAIAAHLRYAHRLPDAALATT
jgi:hypothetical protein